MSNRVSALSLRVAQLTAPFLIAAAASACSGRERKTLSTPTATASSTATASATATEIVLPTRPTGTQTEQALPGETATPTDTATETGTGTNTSTSTFTDTGTAVNTDTGITTSTGLPPSDGEGGANADGYYVVNGANVTAQNLSFQIPGGWVLHQDAVDGTNIILGFARGQDYFRLYVKKSAGASTFSLGSVVSGGTPRSEKIGARDWQRVDTASGQVSVAAFSLEFQGHVYWGFGRAASPSAATEAVSAFLGSVK